MNSLYALAIIAHPDDESFLLAGTTLKFKEEGKEIGVVCVTRGEKGIDRHNRQLTPDEMAKIRTQELYTACNILRCDCKKFFNYPDGGLDQIDLGQLVNELTDLINFYRPQIVLTFGQEGISGHRDHITMGSATMEASRKAEAKPSEIWCACIPSSLVEDFSQHLNKQKIHHSHFVKTELKGVADEKITKINIQKYKDTKLAALKAHKSQYAPHLIWPGFLEHEYFEIIKLK